MFNNCDWCNLKQSWLIDLFIICWKFLFLCKSWLILSALILLLFNCSNLVYTFLLRSYLDLFALLTLVNLRIFLLKYLTQILFKSICSNLFTLLTLIDLRIFLLKYLAQILLRSCSNILLRFICLNLFVLLTLVDLKIFLLRYFTQILLRSCSDLAQILLKYLAQIYLFYQHLSTWESSCSDLSRAKYLSKKCILLLVFCFLYHASYSRCNYIDMCILFWIIRSHCVVYTHSIVLLVIMMILFFQVEWWWWLRVSELSWSCVICWLWLLISDLWHDQK